MANETNADQAFTGGRAIVDRNRDGGEAEVRVGTLLDLDLLDCPVCCGPLTIPIFKCDNGHIACSSCCTNLMNKCPYCKLPIGNHRCVIMERVLEASIVPCPHAKHGCTEKFSYGKELAHEKECCFALRSSDELITSEVRSGTLSKLDLLECPVCCHALTGPTFQCDNGHIACSSCCTKLRFKCPTCTFPIGLYRCRIIERVVEAIIVPCPNAKHGCTKKFSYGLELVHEKECGFALCYCPARNCDYAGVYKNLYSHYNANHNCIENQFLCGRSKEAWLHVRDTEGEKILVFQESPDGPLVVFQCFEEPQGVYVTVNCIAPCVPGAGEFSYDISYSWEGRSMTFGLEKMNKIQKVSFETPEKDFMLVPYYFMGVNDAVKTNLCIRSRRRN